MSAGSSHRVSELIWWMKRHYALRTRMYYSENLIWVNVADHVFLWPEILYPKVWRPSVLKFVEREESKYWEVKYVVVAKSADPKASRNSHRSKNPRNLKKILVVNCSLWITRRERRRDESGRRSMFGWGSSPNNLTNQSSNQDALTHCV